MGLRGVGCEAAREMRIERWGCGAVRERGSDREEGVGARVHSGARLGHDANGPAWLLGCMAAGLLLSLSTLFINRELEERKGEKRRLEEEFGHAVNFPGLAKCAWSKKNGVDMIAGFKFKLI